MDTVSTVGETLVHPAIEDLRGIATFTDLPEDQLEWLRQNMTLRELEPGEISVHAGEPADRLFVIFQGEIRAERPDGGVYVGRAGQVTGMLPYSRLTHFPVTARAVLRSRVGVLGKEHFPELMQRMPMLLGRLVNVLADRIRETTKADEQREKLLALGKLSAGLAHELNNPASALRRAADSLSEAVQDFRTVNLKIGQMPISPEARQFLSQFEFDWAEKAAPTMGLDTVERSDREEELGSWLEKLGVQDAWQIAGALVDAGGTRENLEPAVVKIPKEFLGAGLKRLSASIAISRLVEEIQSSTTRISDLVRAVKDYSYMDQAPEQDVDVHDGIENTLTMLKHRLKGGVEVIREYDRTIPKLCLRGSEMNQVWTNLIGNAIDAMNEKGKLRIRTSRELERVLVEIHDTGSGIAAEIRHRVFDPFFTTKGVGEGTGLGLDIASRIIRMHGGEITFDSKPGDTRFCVRLPLGKAA